MRRLLFIVSGNGGTLKEVYRLLSQLYSDLSITVVADRACGANELAKQMGFEALLADYKNSEGFDRYVAKIILQIQPECIILNYDRLISARLLEKIVVPVINLHYSLLPAFKGFKAVEQAIESGAKFVGATVHVVDHQADNGAIVSQVVLPMPLNATFEQVMNLVFDNACVLLANVICCLFEGVIVISSENQLGIKEYQSIPNSRFNFPLHLKMKESLEVWTRSKSIN